MYQYALIISTTGTAPRLGGLYERDEPMGAEFQEICHGDAKDFGYTVSVQKIPGGIEGEFVGTFRRDGKVVTRYHLTRAN